MLLAALALSITLSIQVAPERAALAGWYERASGGHVLITFGATGGLRLFDFDAPQFDLLAERGGGAFTWRRSDAAEARLDFVREGERVTGFEWSAAADERGSARRDDAYGYSQSEVHLWSGEIELCALLMLPRDPAGASVRHPGAVVIHGSGDSDRDNVWAFSIANHLARSGIAVCLPDKRGCGRSRGDWKAVGFDALADDALRGLDALAARPEVDPARIGLVGLSQGGWIAPLAAHMDPRVAFSVSVSGAAVTVREQVLHELACTARSKGGGEAVDVARELMSMAFTAVESGEGWDDYVAGVEAAPTALAGAFPTQRDDWRWAWYARVLDFDPVPLWRELARPGLVVYGSEDEHDNVPVAASVERLRALDRANLTCRVYAGSGHALDDPAGKWIRRDFLDELARWVAAVPAR